MRNPPRFRIPLGWQDGPTPRTPFIERLMSDTLVLPIVNPPGRSGAGWYEIERVMGSRSPHIPEKVPCYRIVFGHSTWSQENAIKLKLVRLSQARLYTYVLVELAARRQQWCIREGGYWHGVMYSEGWASATTYCDRSAYISLDRDEQRANWNQQVPDCPACAAFKTAWVALKVFPYEAKRKVARKTDREAAEKKRRAKMPTAFDRIMGDFIEQPIPKPVPVRLPVPEQDPLSVYEESERERKLSAARDRNQRFKNTQREMKRR